MCLDRERGRLSKPVSASSWRSAARSYQAGLDRPSLRPWRHAGRQEVCGFHSLRFGPSRPVPLFLEDTQNHVSGTAFVHLLPYRFELQGIEAPFDMLQSKMGQYGEMNNGWSGEDVKGFTKIYANANKIYHQLHKETVCNK